MADPINEYTTIDGDFIDQIVWRHYGYMDRALEAVMNLDLNRHLRLMDEHLPAGIKIYLPQVPPDERRLVRIWD